MNTTLHPILDKLSMRVFYYALLLVFIFASSQSYSQCTMTIDGAAVITVPSSTFMGTQGNITMQDVSGAINNSGTVECQGTWTQNAASGGLIGGSAGTVLLDGASQTVTGTTPTTFSSLTISGSGIKTLSGVGATVNANLNLNALELATGANVLTLGTSATISQASGSTTGFVSSTTGGYLSWLTNSINAYLFPVGQPGGGLYRPVIITPGSATANTFNVRLVNHSPSTDGYTITSTDGSVCSVNSSFYDLITQSGSASAGITMYFTAGTDGNYADMMHWQGTPVWTNMSAGPLNTGTYNGGLTNFLNVAGWSNYSSPAFALGKPLTPAAPVATAASTGVCLGFAANWNASTNAVYYVIDVSTNSGFTSFVGSYNSLNVGNVTTYNVTGLTSGQSYYYRVRAVDDCGTSSSSNVIGPVTPSPTVTVGSAQTICQGGTTAGLNGSITGYSTGGTWTDGGIGGSWSPNNTTLNATWSPPSGYSGNATLTLTTNSPCAGVTATVAITVRPTPTASISGNTTVCIGATAPTITFTNPETLPVTITYNINGGSNQTINVNASSTNTVTQSTASSGTFAYNLVSIVYQATPVCSNSISGTATVTVSPNASVASVSGTSPLCISATATYTANSVVLSGGTGTWSTSNSGIASVNSGSGLVQGVSAGTCTITYTINGGCNATPSASQNVTITPNNTITLSSGVGTNTQSTSPGGPMTTITYTTTGATGASVSGLPPGIGYSFGSNTVTISGTPSSTGTYNYTVTLSGGCNAGTATGTITVTNSPCTTPGYWNSWPGGEGCGVEGAIAPTCYSQSVPNGVPSTGYTYVSMLGNHTYTFSSSAGSGWSSSPYISIFQSANSGGTWTYVGGAANSYTFTTGTSAGSNAPATPGSSWYYLVEVQNGNNCALDQNSTPWYTDGLGDFIGSASLTYQENGTSAPSSPSAGTAGSSVWNVYAYNYSGTMDNALVLSGTTYLGGYTSNSLSYSTLDEWNNVGAPSYTPAQTIGSPYAATITGYSGCNVNNNYHMIQHVRQGFTCGVYKIDIADPANESDNLGLDDDGRLYLNGNQIWGQDGCCIAGGWQNLAAGNTGTNIGAQWVYLGSSDKLDMRHADGCGGSEDGLVLTSESYTTLSATVSSAQSICNGGGTPSLLTATGAGGTPAYYNGGSYSYQWQSSPNNSTWSNISAATNSTYQPGALSTSTYYRVLVSDKCTSNTPSPSIEMTVIPTPALADGTFGTNQWNVFGYNATTWTNYYGYYQMNTSTLSFDTRLGVTNSNTWSWNQTTQGPSNASGYVGCPFGNTNISYRFMRKGFPCGYYTILYANDDAAYLKIDGTTITSPGCCTPGGSAAMTASFGSFYLGPNSTVEFGVEQGGGDTYGGLQFNLSGTPLTVSSSGPYCWDGTGTLTSNYAVPTGGTAAAWTVTSGGSYGSIAGTTFTGTNTTSSNQSVGIQVAEEGCTAAQTDSVYGEIGVPTVNGINTNFSASYCGSGTLTAVVGTNGTTCRFYSGSLSNLVASGTSYLVTTSGTYYVTSYDAGESPLDCESSPIVITVTITPSFTVSLTPTLYNTYGVSCNNSSNGNTSNGSILATATSSAYPVIYSWSTGASNTVSTGPDNNTISSLAAGSYTVHVSDASGCGASATVTLNAPPALTVSLATSSYGGYGTNCNTNNDGTVTPSPTGGTGTYTTYSWSSTPTGYTSSSTNISGLSAQTYNLTVTDNNGCTTSASVVITKPAVISFTYNIGYACSGGTYSSAAITLYPSGGASGTYNYSGDGGSTWQSSPTFSGLTNGTYTFEVQDASYTSCTSATQNITVTLPSPGSSVGQCNIIYVATTGNASNPGTENCPTTLANAFTLYASNSARNIIAMATGTYTFSSTISIPAGITIDGNYDPTTWLKSTAYTTILNINPTASSGAYMGFQAAGNNFQLKDLTINVQTGGATGTYSNQGQSVYGVYTNGYTGWTISRCTITTGAGSAGNSGTYSSSSGGGYSGGSGAFTGYDPYTGDPVGSTIGGGNGCSDNPGGSGATGGSGSGPGGGGGGGGGSSCTSGGCNIFGCNAGGCTGGNGSTGSTGGSGASLSQASGVLNASLYSPVNGSTGNAGSGGGGGGGGGPGEGGTCCTCDCGNGYAFGGTGGQGGSGGAGGQGGYGGGGSFGIYVWGGTGTIQDCSITTGAGGTGGAGATGHPGASGSGGAGGLCRGGCDGGCGGAGAGGGTGGQGGTGQQGSNGISQAIVSLNSASISGSGQVGTIPNTGTVTANWYSGCTNSEITITKTTGVWGNIGSNPYFEDNLTNSTTSYTTSSSPATIYYSTGSGNQNITIGSSTLANFIMLTGSRLVVPSSSLITAVTAPCNPASIQVSNTLTTLQAADISAYSWQVTDVSSPTINIWSSTAANPASTPATVNPPIGGWVLGHTYQIRLQLQESCCGWSIPMYQTFTIAGALTQVSTITQSPTSTICATQSGVTYTASTVAGATTYTWALTGGGTITGGQGTQTITVTWGPAVTGATVSVIPKNACTPSTDGPSKTITLNVNGLPTPVISSIGPTTFCNPGSVQLVATSGSGGGTGSGSFTYAWSPPTDLSATTGTPVTSTMSTAGSLTYTLVATEGGSGCSASATQTVIDVATPSGGSIATVTTCPSVAANVTIAGTSNATAYTWALPGGLSGSSTTATISVTGSTAGNYTVTATPQDVASGITCTGSAVTGTVTISPSAPTSLSYTINSPSYCVGTAITTNSATSSGGVVTSYSVSPPLPTGLSLNTSTGDITGTPTTATAAATYTVTATNSCGYTTVGLVITVVPNVTSYGSITASAGTAQSLCPNVTPAGTFSVTGASGGSGTFAYQWYSQSGLQSAPGGAIPGSWTLIGGATNSTFAPSGTSNSISYACVVTPGSPSCSGTPTWATGVLNFTVSTPTVFMTGGNDSVCVVAASTNTLTASTTYTATWQWQSSTDDLSFSDISGATNSTYNAPTDVVGELYYHAIATYSGGSGCTPATSNNEYVYVAAQPTIGTQPGSTAMCQGGTGNIVVIFSGGVGATYQWQTNYGFGYSNVADNNSNAPGITYGGTGAQNPLDIISSGSSYTGTLPYKVIIHFSGVGCTPSITSSSGSATINHQVVINTQPASSTSICAGNSASLTIAATPGFTLTYEWQYNNSGTWVDVSAGTPAGFTYSGAASATLSMSTNNGTTPAGSYGYRCLVHSTGTDCNDATSNTGTIAVTAHPTAFTPTVSANPVCITSTGGGTNIQVTGSVSGINYQLQNVAGPTNIGSPVAGTGGTISMPTGSMAANAIYQVVASTSGGCATTATIQDTVTTVSPDIALGIQIASNHYTFGTTGSPALPSGWSNPATSGLQWDLATTNIASSGSYSYINGSGGTSAASTGAYITTPIGASTTTVSLISATINTTGYTNISVQWGAQKSAGYAGTVSLYYSTDNGSTWSSAVPFTDVPDNLTGYTWSLVNNGVQIKLPIACNNISTLQLKWTANAAGAGIYYSMNDIGIYGLPPVTNCNGTSVTVGYLNTSCSANQYNIGTSTTTWAAYPSLATVTNASLPSSPISITVPVPATTGTYDVDFSVNDGAGHSSATINFPVSADPAMNILASLDNCSCNNTSNVFGNVVTVYASGGSGLFYFSSAGVVDSLISTIDASEISYSGTEYHSGVKGIFWSKADGNSHTYTIGDGVCANTASIVTQATTPSTVPFGSATGVPTAAGGNFGGGNGISGSFNNSGQGDPSVTNVNGVALTCHQTADFGSNWVTYQVNNLTSGGSPMPGDSTNNKAVVEINNNGFNLDSVSVSVYRDAYLPEIPNAATTTTACYGYQGYALERHFMIKSTKSTGANAFTTPVGVRLYFTDAEFQDLAYWTMHVAETATGQSAGCAYLDTVTNINSIYVTKYTGPNEDGNYLNNTAAPTGLYRVFGKNAVLGGNSPLTAIDAQASLLTTGGSTNLHYVQMNVTEFSEFWLGGSSGGDALPVSMIYLQAQALNNDSIQVSWATASEINNHEFDVERSTDAQTWATIGVVPGHDNSTQQNNYAYNDLNVTPGPVYYYRLKQVDNNGNYKYTDIVQAQLTATGTFTVMNFIPNPTAGSTQLTVLTPTAQQITVDFYDMLGQRVMSSIQQLTAGHNTIDFDLRKFASGTYSAVVTAENQLYTKKIVVTR